MSHWYDFVSGAVFTLFAVIGLIFTKYFVRTRDRFFLLFALGFWTLSVERMLTVGAVFSEAQRPLLYLFRLVAFGFILFAIWQKNREQVSELQYEE